MSLETAGELLRIEDRSLAAGREQRTGTLTIIQEHEITALSIIDRSNKLLALLFFHNLPGKGKLYFWFRVSTHTS